MSADIPESRLVHVWPASRPPLVTSQELFDQVEKSGHALVAGFNDMPAIYEAQRLAEEQGFTIEAQCADDIGMFLWRTGWQSGYPNLERYLLERDQPPASTSSNATSPLAQAETSSSGAGRCCTRGSGGDLMRREDDGIPESRLVRLSRTPDPPPHPEYENDVGLIRGENEGAGWCSECGDPLMFAHHSHGDGWCRNCEWDTYEAVWIHDQQQTVECILRRARPPV